MSWNGGPANERPGVCDGARALALIFWSFTVIFSLLLSAQRPSLHDAVQTFSIERQLSSC